VAGGRVWLGEALRPLPWRFAAALLLMVLALGRPQWGQVPAADAGHHEVVIAIDLSRSMLATDTLPSRLERARGLARRLADQSALDVGLIGFAGRAYLLAAPSPDRTLFDMFVAAVHPDQMIVPGSDYVALFRVASTAFTPQATRRTLVLLSDGEAEPTDWQTPLRQLQSRGIAVVTVGLGTTAGATIRDAKGEAIRSRLDKAALEGIARATGGAALDAADAAGLAARLAASGGNGEGSAPAAGTAERYAWFLLPAILFLLWSAAVEWPARPHLPRSRRAFPAAALMTGLALFIGAGAGHAVKPAAEPDPLREVKQVVARLVDGPEPGADDYLALARVSLAYGETHRQHLHPLQIGVLMDGVAAVDAGAALEPGRPEWAVLRGKLNRLMRPRRTTDDPEEGDGEPQGDPDAGEEAPDPDEAGFDPKATPPDDRRVGGTQRSGAEQAEWRVPSLVRPAYVLEKLRAADQPGELFRILQAQEPAPRKAGQTW
ncbi:VWA domain-containing protein, partial [Sandarakinorhabdus rubra]|uniref:VWA domain-containing protein n=1 Tax=Sandarakinorhabdus rubra TaxID=2672568 RepID=UPI0013DA4FA4